MGITIKVICFIINDALRQKSFVKPVFHMTTECVLGGHFTDPKEFVAFAVKRLTKLTLSFIHLGLIEIRMGRN